MQTEEINLYFSKTVTNFKKHLNIFDAPVLHTAWTSRVRSVVPRKHWEIYVFLFVCLKEF